MAIMTPFELARTSQQRHRSIRQHRAGLSRLDIPNVYVFNVGKQSWGDRVASGKSFTVPACPEGKKHSEPIVIPMLGVTEYDPASGSNDMGVLPTYGQSGEQDGLFVYGDADDVIGKHSSSPGLGLRTTNLEWFGCFVSANEVPTEAELLAAHDKLKQMMQLIYAYGAEKVQAGKEVPMIDRPRYNEAAAYLGAKPLWGNLDHTKGSCPECHEDIIEGANFCKHCQQAIDPASVAARAKKREREAAKLLKEEEVESA